MSDLCNSPDFKTRKGQVRDAPELKILECKTCGLVTLSSLDHIQPGHYEQSGMHGDEPPSIEHLLRQTACDDERRFKLLKSVLPNKRVLDFGCGNGGFMLRAAELCKTIVGVELEARVRNYWGTRLTIVPDLENAGGGYDIITAFHVVEHLCNPLETLVQLKQALNPKGRMIVEVPSSDDALLTLYDCRAFQHFTYWSQHLFLFNAETLRQLARKAGLEVIAMDQFQRYPLSNHLYWLSQGKPGGHDRWSFLDSSELNQAYANALGSVGHCDTLIAYLGHEK